MMRLAFINWLLRNNLDMYLVMNISNRFTHRLINEENQGIKVNISTILYLDDGYSGKDKGYPR